MRRFIVLLFILLTLSCTEDKVIVNSTFKQKFLLASDENQSSMILFDSEDGILEDDVYLKNNGKKLQGKVFAIEEWGNLLFLIMKDNYAIEIIGKNDFKIVSTIDFSGNKKKPSGIDFVNSTDAYISFENDSNVVLYDLYNFQIAKYIKVPFGSVDLVAVPPYVYVVNQLDDKVSIIDSRTDELINQISVKPAPTFIDYADNIGKTVVVSLGEGKIDQKQKTAAYLTLIDINSQNKTSEIPIAAGTLEASEILPKGMIIAGNYCFVVTSDFIFRYDVKNEPSQIQLLSKKSIKSLKYFPLRNKVIVLENDNTFTYSNIYTLAAAYSFQIEKNISVVHPL